MGAVAVARFAVRVELPTEDERSAYTCARLLDGAFDHLCPRVHCARDTTVVTLEVLSENEATAKLYATGLLRKVAGLRGLPPVVTTAAQKL